MLYSPVRRSSAGSKLPLLPLDLHVLSLPPAFNLSHDQTLQFKSFKDPKIPKLAQDKTLFRRVTVLIFRVRNTSASAHTNCLVNLLKSFEPSLNQGRTFYSESRPCQPLRPSRNSPASAFAEPRILLRIAALSSPLKNSYLNQIFQKTQRLTSLRTRPQHRVRQKWCAFYSPQRICQRAISTYCPGFRFPPIRPLTK